MIDYPTFLQIKHLHRDKHLKCSQIAGELSLDERTVSKWLGASTWIEFAIRSSLKFTRSLGSSFSVTIPFPSNKTIHQSEQKSSTPYLIIRST